MKKELTHKEISARGGKAQWEGISKEQRFKIIQARWLKGRKNKAKQSNGALSTH